MVGVLAGPTKRHQLPEPAVLAAKAGDRIAEAVAGLPSGQRSVITLRDVEGLTGAEVCEVLGLSAGNQRVLLHRARTSVRAALEQYLDDRGTTR